MGGIRIIVGLLQHQSHKEAMMRGWPVQSFLRYTELFTVATSRYKNNVAI